MKMYLISDNVDTLTGMRLAGVDGIVVHERDELKEAIEKAMSDPEIGACAACTGSVTNIITPAITMIPKKKKALNAILRL